MLKRRITLLALSLSMATVNTTAIAATEDPLAQSVCSFVASNNKNDLRRTLADNRIRLKTVYDGISCNGLPLVRFAITSNAVEAGDFIVKQLPGSHFNKSGDVQWAKENGHANSPVLSTIQARISGA